ncbi:unnamed protein product [Aphanomyces euteiches]|uniref:Acyltransferase n=1 Tax=Aphanomyces euteiches TaxID=100861 RepID=A0A6G0WZG7_9STRA|nr:hypothetical protein Ae201684_010093 [Aphanomyces euteiches]KAH9099648.1 hypothetical protein Ae201684P_018661 [Aphanomyces euteiches]KAH9154513.1 hypothetical protein AeRB84_003393 [Aphanomyces euteiches]
MSVIAIAGVGLFVASLALLIQQTSLDLWQDVGIALIIGYLPSYLEPSPTTASGRFWPWWALQDWRWVLPFVKKSGLHFEAPLTSDKQYVIAAHPHGMASYHHGVLMGNISTPKFRDVVGENRRHLGASIVFRIPVYREIMLFFGVVDASRRVANAVLKSGKTLVILVGGVIEQMMAERGKHLVYAKKRKGHCKLAIQHGVPVVPVYCFGETDTYDCSTFMLPFRQWVAKKFSIALTICSGPYWWFPAYPFDVEFHHVFGKPIETTKNENPTQEEIDRVHSQYVAELERIFHKYKAQFGHPDATLTVC